MTLARFKNELGWLFFDVVALLVCWPFLVMSWLMGEED